MVTVSVERVEDLPTHVESAPDIVLLDFDSSHLRSGESIRRAKDAFPNIAVIVIASRIIPLCLIYALQAGMDGCLLKTCSGEQLVRAIHAAVNGETIINSVALQLTVQQLTRLALSGVPDQVHLTAQELTVIKVAAEGLSNKEIARRLSISHRTVCTHFQNIFTKLKVDSRLKAVLYALRSGWISEWE